MEDYRSRIVIKRGHHKTEKVWAAPSPASHSALAEPLCKTPRHWPFDDATRSLIGWYAIQRILSLATSRLPCRKNTRRNFIVPFFKWNITTTFTIFWYIQTILTIIWFLRQSTKNHQSICRDRTRILLHTQSRSVMAVPAGEFLPAT